MTKRFYRLLAVLLLLASLLGGCSDKTAGQVFRLDILSEPSSIDPQTASSDEQYLILLNTMEGLLKMDENQTPTEAAAESYAVSADGLTYTFLLRKDMLWSDGKTPVTAYDFQFAFQRLFDPQTQSPAAVNFTCIRGSSAALSGEGSVQDIGNTACQTNSCSLTARFSFTAGRKASIFTCGKTPIIMRGIRSFPLLSGCIFGRKTTCPA